MQNLKENIIAAEKRIRPYVKETPLDYSEPLSKKTHAHVYLKCDYLQHTGAFKVRGAFNKILSLTEAQQKKGVVAASSGNHGAAVAYALNTLKIPGIIFVPENAAQTKIDNIHNYDIPLELYGQDCMDAEIKARAYADEHGMVYASPYNDIDVIAGQGTLGLEIMHELDDVDAIFVPVGGGGLISGIAAFVKSVSPKTKMFGCLPENSPVMAESIKAGKIIEMETLPTLSDATAGNIEPGAITFEMCQAWVDDYVLVSEAEIQQAIITLIKTQHALVEGASAVALASFLKIADQFEGKKVVVVLSGANISLDVLKKILD
jgi:threonine dehydratase